MTRLRRLWLTWLALPEVVRLGIVIAIGLFGWLLFAPAARAEEAVARNGKNEMRLMDTACSHGGTLAILQPQWRDKFKNARAMIDGKMWFACWILEDPETVHVLFEDGDEVDFELATFAPDPGI